MFRYVLHDRLKTMGMLGQKMCENPKLNFEFSHIIRRADYDRVPE